MHNASMAGWTRVRVLTDIVYTPILFRRSLCIVSVEFLPVCACRKGAVGIIWVAARSAACVPLLSFVLLLVASGSHRDRKVRAA